MAGDKLTSHDLYGDDSRMILLDKQLKGINAELDSVVKKASAMNTALRTTPSSTSAGQKKIAAAATDAEKLIQAEQKLQLARSDTARQMAAISVATAKVRRENILAAKSAQAVKGSYDDLSAQLSIVTIKWRSLTKAERETTEQGKALSAQRKSLIEQLKQLDASQGVYSRNVGNYKSAIGGLIGSIKQLVGAYSRVAAARTGLDTIFTQTRALDSLDVALKTTTGSEIAAADAKAFLADLTDRLGISLVDTTKSYLKFSIASKSAGFTVKQSQEIFESFGKAGSTLGLRTDEIEGIFKALEQIMSKGTVQAEELRGQLGDRLPGAFTILAESMGVSTAELGKMLKEGKVLANEVLPNFAKQVEKTYGIDQTDKVNNLAAAQGRFKREITLTIEQLGASGAFKSFFDTLTGIFTVIRENLGVITALAKGIGLTVAALVAVRLPFIAFTTTVRLATAAQVAFNTALRSNPIGLAVSAAITLIGVLSTLKSSLGATKDEISDVDQAVETATASTKKQNAEFNVLVESLKRVGTNEVIRKEAIEKLNTTYREYIPNLIDEKTSHNDLNIALAYGNKLFEDRITLLAFKATLDAQEQNIIENRTKLVDLDRQAIKLEEERNRLLGIRDGFQVTDSANPPDAFALAKVNEQLQKNSSLTEENRKLQEGLQAEYQATLDLAKQSGIDIKKLLAADATGSTKTPGEGTIDKTLLDSLQRRRELNALEQDERKKDIEDLQIFFDEKKALFELNGLDIIKLQEYYNQKLAEINDKYLRDNKVTEHLQPLAVKPLVRSNKSIQDQLLAEFKLQQEIAELRFSAEEHTSEEIQKFKLSQEIELYRKLLEIQKNGGEILSAEEIKRYQALIPELLAIYSSIKPPSQGGEYGATDIFSLFKLNLNDDQKQAISDAFAFAKEQAASYFETVKALSEQEVDIANNRVAEAQRALQYEMDARRDGYADKVETVQKELALAKKAQEQALRQRQKVQKQELALNTALEASSLAVGVANTLKIGPLGIPLVAVMLGAFLTAKIKAFQLANKTTFGKGDVIDVQGGSHASGNDTPLGMSFNGKPGFVERGEKVGIVNKKAVRKYGSSVNDIFNAMNRMQLDQYLNMNRRTAEDIPLIVNASSSFDSSRMENGLDRINRNLEARETIEGNYRVVRKGNHVTRYRIK